MDRTTTFSMSDAIKPFTMLANVVERLVRMNTELLDTIEFLQTIMPCGHPLICASGTDEGTWDCQWCKDVVRAKALSNMKASSRAGRMPR